MGWRNIKLTLQYEGTSYCGWQRQKNGLSIQKILENTLRKIFNTRIRTTCAGRTDSGVHALGQVVNFKTLSRIHARKIMAALNACLPDDIVITGAREMPLDFNARFDAKAKLYRFRISNAIALSPFLRRYAIHVPYRLDIGTMKEAARHISGRMDFSSFRSANSPTRTSVRTIFRIDVKKKGSVLSINVLGDGFLYNMVRIIAGTLIDVGRGRLKAADVKKIVRSRNRSNAGPTAPARGLTLIRVIY